MALTAAQPRRTIAAGGESQGGRLMTRTGDDAIYESTPYHQRLIEQARRWIKAGEFNVAIVVLQTAAEIKTEQVFDAILSEKRLTELKKPISELTASYNLGNDKVRNLYVALTGDKVQGRDFWHDFKLHGQVRRRVVHGKYKATSQEAQTSLTAVKDLVTHLTQVERPEKRARRP